MRAARRPLTSQSGQTTTEYLMIAGVITAAAIVILGMIQPKARCVFARTVSCMLNDYDDCSSPAPNLPVCPADIAAQVPTF